MIIFFQSIPFVHQNDDPFACFMRIAGNFFVLLLDALFRIQHDHNDIRTLNCADGTHDAVFFRRFVDLAFFPDSGCIDHPEFCAFFINEHRIDSVTGCACNIRYDYALFSQNGIHQGRFPDIRTADKTEVDDILFFGIFIF
ncbi:hypothetical protein SDC9_183980 [bioreactor metagenome]|uniref:Uncharacterized protein n=1 Tax=bioreactor metagenome TaxID=1076179 RepID=A0A645HBQ4_9ZZZZ